MGKRRAVVVSSVSTLLLAVVAGLILRQYTLSSPTPSAAQTGAASAPTVALGGGNGGSGAALQPSSPAQTPNEPIATTESSTASASLAPPTEAQATASSTAAAQPGSAVQCVANRPAFLPTEAAPPEEWRALITHFRSEKNVVALQSIAEALPGRDPAERARLIADATAALGSVGGEDARRSFDDLLASPHREVKLAAMNTFVVRYPRERDAVLTAWVADPDPLVRKKAEALRVALAK